MKSIELAEASADRPAVVGDLEDQAQMVRRACQGDEAAWEMLLKIHQEPVFRFAYLIVGDADEAEDITQETFIRAYRGLARFDSHRPLRPWLLKIAANLSRNRGRAFGRYLAALRRAFMEEAHQRPASIDEVGEQNLESQLLWQTVRRLSLADQQIIYLRYFLEVSVEDTAHTLGIPPGTVKSRLHRALERLRIVIDREVPELRDERDK